MIWPVAALAIGLLAFVIAYGSVMQARLASGGLGFAGTEPPVDDSVDA